MKNWEGGPTFNGKHIQQWMHLRTSGDDETRWEAMDAIRHLCKPVDSVPPFIDTLRTDEDWRARALAAHALFDLAIDPHGDRSRLSINSASLRTCLSDSSPDIRDELTAIMRILDSEDRESPLTRRPCRHYNSLQSPSCRGYSHGSHPIGGRLTSTLSAARRTQPKRWLAG